MSASSGNEGSLWLETNTETRVELQPYIRRRLELSVEGDV